MRRLIFAIIWVGLVGGTISVITSTDVEWTPIIVMVIAGFVFVTIFGIVTLNKSTRVAIIPILLGGFCFSVLCTFLEVRDWFLVSLVYSVGLMIYFLGYEAFHGE
ncbi:hypothetical protein N780_02070 [Pontibacillus chungwhensis BH030062]|uniref:Uncharacterized protein n=1 Tax=Pontibacillus chungwhensis BH030062 TaxID=1385513 RepID=A0A0A2V077_9BACI|nr:hypothetical protein [Pontibacillus chungwhensis]KGP92408.1 hypothetical protein N780_02070 [Pontibacillus chungwhensis BH030062]